MVKKETKLLVWSERKFELSLIIFNTQSTHIPTKEVLYFKLIITEEHLERGFLLITAELLLFDKSKFVKFFARKFVVI